MTFRERPASLAAEGNPAAEWRIPGSLAQINKLNDETMLNLCNLNCIERDLSIAECERHSMARLIYLRCENNHSVCLIQSGLIQASLVQLGLIQCVLYCEDVPRTDDCRARINCANDYLNRKSNNAARTSS